MSDKKPGLFSRMMGGIVGGLIGIATGAFIGIFKGIGQIGSVGILEVGGGGVGFGLAALALLPAMAIGAVVGMGIAAYQGIKNGVQNGFVDGCKAGAVSAFTWESPSAASAAASSSDANMKTSAQADTGAKKPVNSSPVDETSRLANIEINKMINQTYPLLHAYQKDNNKENLKVVEEKIAAIKEKSLGITESDNNKRELKNIVNAVNAVKDASQGLSAAQAKPSAPVSEPVAAVAKDYVAPTRKM